MLLLHLSPSPSFALSLSFPLSLSSTSPPPSLSLAFSSSLFLSLLHFSSFYESSISPCEGVCVDVGLSLPVKVCVFMCGGLSLPVKGGGGMVCGVVLRSV